MWTVLAFLPALCSGILVAQLLWPERSARAVALKVFFGIGLGMGLRSILYFLYLLVFPGRHLYIYIDLLVLVLLVGLTVLSERRAGDAAWAGFSIPHLTPAQRIALAVASVVVLISLLSTANYLLRRRQGDWDAWMMYNRAARFIFKDQGNWLASFSPRMDPIFHPDYPLLLAGDIAAGWDILGHESSAVPMLQSALFSVACLGLVAAALASVKSFGQATLAVTILWGLPVFVNEGARQMADVPLAFFILAAAALLALYTLRPHSGLLALAGLSAGLGAWTKNEGMVLVAGASLALFVLLWRKHDWKPLIPVVAAAALPLAVVISFRLFIAPSGDILAAAEGGSLSQVLDISRHTLILGHMWREVLSFGGWAIPGVAVGAIPILILLHFVLRLPGHLTGGLGHASVLIILGVQSIGYYAAYLISPYDLEWHLSYSSTRIVLQVFPLILFFVLISCRSVEDVVLGRNQGAADA